MEDLFGIPKQKISGENQISWEFQKSKIPKHYFQMENCVPFAFATNSRPLGFCLVFIPVEMSQEMEYAHTVPWKYQFGVLMHHFYCNFWPTGFSN